MPRFTYQCETHGAWQTTLPKREDQVPCPVPLCGKPSKNIIKVGTSVVFERLDNGAMAKAVERMHDVEELINERSTPVPQDDAEDDEQGDDRS